MSQENVEFVRKVVELGNAGDLDAVASLFHPDVEIRDLQHPPDVPEVQHGREALRATWNGWLEALGNWRVEVQEYVDADRWVLCDSRWRATGKGSTAATEWRVTDAYEIQDGMIVTHIEGFPDIAAALRHVCGTR
jgi:ketosteroid isomerase-like protein